MSQALQKVALITGAARGIGLGRRRTFPRRRLARGACSISISETLNRTTRSARGKSTPMLPSPSAATSPTRRASLGPLAQSAQKFGRLDALVNNAGIAIFKPILDVTYEDWSRVLAVNLTGPFLCTQAAVPLMRDQWRRRHRQYHLNIGFARLDAALGLRHQQSWPCAPDPATGGRTGLAWHPRQCRRARVRSTPPWQRPFIRRKSAPPIMMPFRSTATAWSEELAEAIFFLCSDRASYITGQIHCRRWRVRGDRHWTAGAARQQAERLAITALRRRRGPCRRGRAMRSPRRWSARRRTGRKRSTAPRCVPRRYAWRGRRTPSPP